MKIIQFERQYRDDLIFMVLEAKNAIGRVPTLNDDLLDIEETYLRKGDGFWIALDENKRVIGCIGCHLLPDGKAAIHRLYVRYSLKRQGIGSELLKTAEAFARENGRTLLLLHLGEKKTYAESRQFYPKHGYTFVDEDHMKKRL